MQLLSLLLDHKSLTITRAAQELQVAPSTAHRLLVTMAARGFVTQGPGKRYQLGPQLARKTTKRSAIASLTQRMRDPLAHIHAQCGETVHLMVLTGSHTQFVYGMEGDQTLRIGLRIGGRIPAHCTSGGKAMLAAMTTASLRSLYADGLPAWPTATHTSLEGLLLELAHIRERGYALNRDESEQGVSAIAVTVPALAKEPASAIAIALPSLRLADHAHEQLAEILLAAQAALLAE